MGVTFHATRHHSVYRGMPGKTQLALLRLSEPAYIHQGGHGHQDLGHLNSGPLNAERGTQSLAMLPRTATSKDWIPHCTTCLAIPGIATGKKGCKPSQASPVP
eukprot:45046-Pelagomonas_calceolata.AAC.2